MTWHLDRCGRHVRTLRTCISRWVARRTLCQGCLPHEHCQIELPRISIRITYMPGLASTLSNVHIFVHKLPKVWTVLLHCLGPSCVFAWQLTLHGMNGCLYHHVMCYAFQRCICFICDVSCMWMPGTPIRSRKDRGRHDGFGAWDGTA